MFFLLLGIVSHSTNRVRTTIVMGHYSSCFVQRCLTWHGLVTCARLSPWASTRLSGIKWLKRWMIMCHPTQNKKLVVVSVFLFTLSYLGIWPKLTTYVSNVLKLDIDIDNPWKTRGFKWVEQQLSWEKKNNRIRLGGFKGFFGVTPKPVNILQMGWNHRLEDVPLCVIFRVSPSKVKDLWTWWGVFRFTLLNDLQKFASDTFPEANIYAENRPSQQNSCPTTIFQGLCSF